MLETDRVKESRKDYLHYYTQKILQSFILQYSLTLSPLSFCAMKALSIQIVCIRLLHHFSQKFPSIAQIQYDVFIFKKLHIRIYCPGGRFINTTYDEEAAIHSLWYISVQQQEKGLPSHKTHTQSLVKFKGLADCLQR